MNQKWDHEVDLVCIGSGIGGLAAAITAHDAGLRALVVEKASLLGGVTAYSMGQVWVPANHIARAAGLEDSEDDGRRYLGFLAGGYDHEPLRERLLEASIASCRYFGEVAGVPWQVCPDYPDYYHGAAPGTRAEGRYLDVAPLPGHELGEWQARTRLSPHVPNGVTHAELFSWGGPGAASQWDWELMAERLTSDSRTLGPGLAAHFVKAALVDRSAEAWVDAPARRLVADGGRVVGVEVETGGRTVAVRATRGVVLATGGYDWAPDLPRHFDHRPDWRASTPPSVTGDHLVLAGEVGAAIAVVPELNVAVTGYHIPGEEHDGEPLYRLNLGTGLPHGILVNRAGERFGDESFYREHQPKLNLWDGLRQEHPNLPCFLVIDQSHRDRYPLGRCMPGEPLPDGLAVSAPTVEGLAAALGIDGPGLARTIERFNRFAADGVDADFGRGERYYSRHNGDASRDGNPNLGPIESPPFYGIELATVSTGVNAAGLRFDRDGQVLHVRGHAIPGLYVAGNAAAYLDVGAGYQSGIANARGMAWAWVAARHAAATPA